MVGGVAGGDRGAAVPVCARRRRYLWGVAERPPRHKHIADMASRHRPPTPG